jgi:hypothetical protein
MNTLHDDVTRQAPQETNRHQDQSGGINVRDILVPKCPRRWPMSNFRTIDRQ